VKNLKEALISNTQSEKENEKGRALPENYVIEGNLRIKSEVAILLPTYCEAGNVARLIEEIENLGINPLILVVDDSSPDGTANVVRHLQNKYSNIVLIIRPSKRGLGTAITDSFKFLLSLEHPPKYVITMDADFSHNPRDIKRLLHVAKKGYNLVIGSRYCKGGKAENWSPIRVLISKIANFIASVLLGLSTKDCTSGLRCYSKALLKHIVNDLHSHTYEIQIETIRCATNKGFYIAELPITFTSRKIGKSKLTFNEIKNFLGYIAKTKFRSYISVPQQLFVKRFSPLYVNLMRNYAEIIAKLKNLM